VVLVSGEAGIGKSSLVEAARGVLPAEGRLLIGYCDDLATRRALGPFRDLVGSVGTGLTRALEDGGDRNRLLEALRTELSWAGHPTVLAVEDVHWADEATLDVLRYLVRRVAGLPAVLLLTYRDDEIDREHPLQQLLGLVSRVERTRRLPLARLSPGAVRQLSAASALDSREVYAVTSGNPFFVTEVIATGDTGHASPTIVDAVLARTRAMEPSTQDALEQLAVVPSTLERWLVDRLVPGGVAALVTAERRGLVSVARTRVGFRHELIRRSIMDSLPAARRIELNQRVLAALLDRDGADLSAIVHHAAEAGDTAAVTRFAPQAADEAIRAGSHRRGRRAPANGRRPPVRVLAGGTGRPAGPVRDRVLHQRRLRAGPRGPVGRGRPAPHARRPTPARREPALAVADRVVVRAPAGRRTGRPRGGRRAGRRRRRAVARHGLQQPVPAARPG
jgi:hypothetical protein